MCVGGGSDSRSTPRRWIGYSTSQRWALVSWSAISLARTRTHSCVSSFRVESRAASTAAICRCVCVVVRWCGGDTPLNFASFATLTPNREEARARIEALGEPFKLEILDSIKTEPITLYHVGDQWWDLCAGPHVETTGEICVSWLICGPIWLCGIWELQ